MFHFTEEQIQKEIIEPIKKYCSYSKNEEMKLSIDGYEDDLPVYLLESESIFASFGPDSVDMQLSSEIIWIFHDPNVPYRDWDPDYAIIYDGQIDERNMEAVFEMVRSILLAGINARVVYRTTTMEKKQVDLAHMTVDKLKPRNLYKDDLYIMNDTGERYDLQYGNIFLHVNAKDAPSSCAFKAKYPVHLEGNDEYQYIAQELAGNCSMHTFGSEEFRRILYTFAETGKFQEWPIIRAEIGEHQGSVILSLFMKTVVYARSGVDIIEVMVPEQGLGKLLMEITMFIDEKKRFVYRNEVTVEEAYRIFEQYYRRGEVPDLAKWTKVSEIAERDKYDNRKITQW